MAISNESRVLSDLQCILLLNRNDTRGAASQLPVVITKHLDSLPFQGKGLELKVWSMVLLL